jgi:hypothetical protein
MTWEEIELDKGDNSITHLSISGLKSFPSWLPDIAPHLLQLRLELIDEDSLRQGTFEWQR